MNEIYCFTFGQNHTHPLGGYPMKDFWIEVHGTFDESREKIVKRFGDKWAFQYLKSEFDPSFFPKGRHEVID